jgi:hypothetical protein
MIAQAMPSGSTPSSPDAPHGAGGAAASPGGFASESLTPRLPLARRSAVVQKVTRLEGRLFDEQGLVRLGVSPELACAWLDEINHLRRQLGWLRLDLHHRHIWPADLAS